MYILQLERQGVVHQSYDVTSGDSLPLGSVGDRIHTYLLSVFLAFDRCLHYDQDSFCSPCIKKMHWEDLILYTIQWRFCSKCLLNYDSSPILLKFCRMYQLLKVRNTFSSMVLDSYFGLKFTETTHNSAFISKIHFVHKIVYLGYGNWSNFHPMILQQIHWSE